MDFRYIFEKDFVRIEVRLWVGSEEKEDLGMFFGFLV